MPVHPSAFTVIPLIGLDIVKEGDDVGRLICMACQRAGLPLREGDILVVAQSIISRAEGRLVDLSKVAPSPRARRLAVKLGKRPELVEVILQSSRSVIRAEQGHLIVETHYGFVCANAGVDSSNVPGEGWVSLLPEDPDRSAREIRRAVHEAFGVDVAVIISDTFGRPFRLGTVNVAIGVAGLAPLRSYVGRTDLFGYRLRSTTVAVADELASAAELVMGEADEGVPVVIIRGYPYEQDDEATAHSLIREPERDIFRR